MQKIMIKKLSMLLIFVMLFTALTPTMAMGQRKYTVQDELLQYKIFYDSIDYMKRGKAKIAYIKFLNKKVQYNFMIAKKNIQKMSDEAFKKYLVTAKLKPEMSKEDVYKLFDKAYNKINESANKTFGKMSNKDIKAQVAIMVEQYNESMKRSFVAGLLIGGGVVAVAAVAGAGYVTYKFFKGIHKALGF